MSKQRIVVFDLETGGLEAKPSIMSRAQWLALEKYDRGPKPAFGVDVTLDPADNPQPTITGQWRYCPGNPIIQIAAPAAVKAALKAAAEAGALGEPK